MLPGTQKFALSHLEPAAGEQGRSGAAQRQHAADRCPRIHRRGPRDGEGAAEVARPSGSRHAHRTGPSDATGGAYPAVWPPDTADISWQAPTAVSCAATRPASRTTTGDITATANHNIGHQALLYHLPLPGCGCCRPDRAARPAGGSTGGVRGAYRRCDAGVGDPDGCRPPSTSRLRTLPPGHRLRAGRRPGDLARAAGRGGGAVGLHRPSRVHDLGPIMRTAVT